MAAAADQTFDGLQHEFYHAWFRFHPEEAVSVGQQDFAGLLRPYDDDEIGALTSLLQKMHSALDELDQGALSPDRMIDYQLMRAAVSVECHDLQELDWRYRNPLPYVPVQAVYQLLIHPVPRVHSAITQRLRAIPRYLRGARSLLSQHPQPAQLLDAYRKRMRAACHWLRQNDLVTLPGHECLHTQRTGIIPT